MEWVLVIAGGAILGLIVQQVVNFMNAPSTTIDTNRPLFLRSWEAKDVDDIEKYNFRKTRWGMSLEEVMQSEYGEGQPLENDEGVRLYYDVLLTTYPATLIYEFQDNKLVSACYSFGMEYLDVNMYMLAFEDIVSMITEKYGKPHSNLWSWANPQYEFNEQMHGIALSLGHLTRHCLWDTKRTKVMAAHMVSNGSRIFLVQYSDTVWEAKNAETQQNKAIENPF